MISEIGIGIIQCREVETVLEERCEFKAQVWDRLASENLQLMVKIGARIHKWELPRL